jgi:DNA-binding NtrC family response regulator
MTEPQILIVDDEPTVLHLASLIVQTAGFPVLTSTNGLEGLSTFQSAKDSISVVITDVQMPTMGGIEMAKAIKSRKKDVKIIFISGYAPSTEISDLIQKWDAEFISKPFDIHSFKESIQRILA